MHPARATCPGALLLLLFASAPLAPAQGHCQLPSWFPETSAVQGRFGHAVAMDERTALVGSPGAGQVEIYERQFQTWLHVQTLSIPGGAEAEFGYAVALDGQRLHVGAPAADLGVAGQGAVHTFSRQASGWQASGVLVSAHPSPYGRFGHTLSADNDWIAVGAPADLGNGRAYVFEWAGGQALPVREFGNIAILHGYASAVALHRPVGSDWARLFVGTPTDSMFHTNAGSVKGFAVSKHEPAASTSLIPADLGPHHLFGYSLATDGEHLVVGARGSWSADHAGGAAYVYALGPPGPFIQAQHMATFLAPGGAIGDQFGHAVAVRSGRVAVGARFESAEGGEQGRVHLYRTEFLGAGAWIFEQSLAPALGKAGEHFGSAVALAPHQVLVGSPQHGGAATGAGAAHLISTAADGLSGGFCPAPLLTAAFHYGPGFALPGAAPQLTLATPAVAGQLAFLTVSGLPVGSLPFLAVGAAPTATALGGGWLLVADPLLLPLPAVGPLGLVGLGWNVPPGPEVLGVPLFLQCFASSSPVPGQGALVHSRGLAIATGY